MLASRPIGRSGSVVQTTIGGIDNRSANLHEDDWNSIPATDILPSDYPTQAPQLFPKSMRGLLKKRVSTFSTTNLQLPEERRGSRLQSDSQPARSVPRFGTVSPSRSEGSDEDTGETVVRPLQLKRCFSLVPERFDAVVSSHSGLPVSSRGQTLLLNCEHLLVFVNCLLIILGLPFSLIFCLRVVPQYERAVIFRLGRLTSKVPAGPGLIFTLPCLDTVKRVDLRTYTFDVPTQEVLTGDSVTVAVNAVVYYRIYDPVMSVVNVKNVNWATRLLAQTTLRNVLGTVDMCRLLTGREHMAAQMQESLDISTATWGMKVERVEIKDVRLPLQLQRTLAAEAEATCAAKAKVIAARGEKEASRSLKEAALEIGSCPTALHLRYLQTLLGISAEKNSTIIFPLPIEIASYFKKQVSPSAADTVAGKEVATSDSGDRTDFSENLCASVV